MFLTQNPSLPPVAGLGISGLVVIFHAFYVQKNQLVKQLITLKPILKVLKLKSPHNLSFIWIEQRSLGSITMTGILIVH